MPSFLMQTDLTNDEQRLLTGQLIAALTEQERIKAEAAETAAEYRTDLKSLEKRIHELKVTLESGRGQVEIDVEERPGPSGVIEIFRAGTDEKVGERPMRTEDRQVGLGFDDPAPAASDEQDAASTPAEAEALRTRRLEAEHADRVLGWIADAKANVTVSALDGGGFLAALDLVVGDGEEPKSLRETGETEDAARAAVLALYAETLPKFEAPTPTWDEVQAAGEAEAVAMPGDGSENNVGEAAVEQPADAQAAEPAPEEVPKALLKAPKSKRAKRMRIEGPDGKEITAESLAAAEGSNGAGAPEPGGDGAPAETPDDAAPVELCTDECAEPAPHQHTEERTAF